MGTTTNYSWEYPDVGGDADTWGGILNDAVIAIDASLKTVADAVPAAVPVGTIAQSLFAFAPTGWVACKGRSLGNASSGATERANADARDLFINLWNQYASLVVQNSGGTTVARGVSGSADFAANRRIVMPDLRGYFIRSWDDGRGIDTGRAFGTFQTASSASTVVAGSGATTAVSAAVETRPVNFAAYTIVKL